MPETARNTSTTGPLSPEDYQELARAQQRAAKIRRAAGVAAFNGWSIAVFAALSALFVMLSALYGDFSITGLLVSLGLAIVAWNEFRGRARLLRFDLHAPTLLGWNQLGFLALIILYCCWSIYAGLTTESELTELLNTNPDATSALNQLGGLEEFTKIIVLAVYGTVIVLSLIFQGLNAYYYFSRRKLVAAYVRETPAWVLEVQRSGMSR